MIQKGLEVGLLQVNCYIIGDEETKEAVVIDPGGDEDEILDVLKHHQLKLEIYHRHPRPFRSRGCQPAPEGRHRGSDRHPRGGRPDAGPAVE